MLRTFEDYLDRIRAMHDDALKAIDGLPVEALDWSPGPEINSMAVLIAHIAGAERYWIADVVGREDSERVRDEEFATQGHDAAALKARLDSTFEALSRTLDALTLPDLEAMRIAPMHRREHTVSWALSHALEHTANHVGHLQIMRQWWDLRAQGSLRLDLGGES